jgi:hypothetical protein
MNTSSSSKQQQEQQQDQERIDSLKRDIQYLRIRDNNATADKLALELQLLEDKIKSRSKSKSKFNSEKITGIDPKYLPPRPTDRDGKELPYSDDPETTKWLREYAANAKIAAEEYEHRRKEQEEEQRKLQEYEKRQREQAERTRESNRKRPEQQYQMFLSGQRPKCGCGCMGSLYYEMFTRNSTCKRTTGLDIEPLMDRLRNEIIASRMTAKGLDEEAYNMLYEFAQPGETYSDVIKRLFHRLAAVEEKAKQEQQQQQQQQ